MKVVGVWSFFAIMLFFSCAKNVEAKIEREDLFHLSYGSFEDELSFSNLYERRENIDSQIFMKDGFFYISNPEAKKVLKFTSFGDLLAIYYNSEYRDLSLHITEKKDESISTLQTIEYSFNYPTFITVTDSKDIYIVDILSDMRLEYDYEDDVALKNIVLHFDEKGNFIEYIGQEGASGSPFPAISHISTNAKNELVVFCKVREDFRLYYYNEKGGLSHKYAISPASFPLQYDTQTNFYINIDNAYNAYFEDVIYIKADYYIEEIDKSSKVKKGIEYDKSVLYIFDRNKKEYTSTINLPYYEFSEIVDGNNVEVKKVYELLGIANDDQAFFITPHKDGYEGATFSIANRKTSTLRLKIPPIMYNVFHMSQDGILSTLLAGEDDTIVSWWKVSTSKKGRIENARKYR